MIVYENAKEFNCVVEKGGQNYDVVLKFASNKLYYHSWINFKYKGKEYIFDPCLQILCEKKYYQKIFEITVKGKVTAKKVKEYFLNYISNPPKKETNEEVSNIMKMLFGESNERTKGEIVQPVAPKKIRMSAPGDQRLLFGIVIREIILGNNGVQPCRQVPQVLILEGIGIVLRVSRNEDLSSPVR